jgi:ABC-type glycerol-3-phosphate transport system permease component
MGFQGSKINPQKFDKSQVAFYIPMALMGIVMILPLIFVISSAFKPFNELFLFPPRFFVREPTLDNFADLFNVDNYMTIFTDPGLDQSLDGSGGITTASRYLLNSFAVTGLTVLSACIVASMAGFALSKMKFKSKKILFEINMVALMFVPAAVTIPRFLVVQNLGLINTYWGHVLPVIAMPVMVFLAKQFSDQIPDALIEAGKIDGAGDYSIFFRLILPLLRPAVATIVIISFQNAWNSVETSNFYMTSESMKTFAFMMTTLTSHANVVAGAGITAAAVLLMFLPNLIIFIFTQSKVMATMAHSGIK